MIAPFRYALRFCIKNKVHTFITISGLAIGLASVMLAAMFVVHENSFDKFHSKSDRIYRLNKINTEPDGSVTPTTETSGMMGPAMVEEFPEVENVIRLELWSEDVVLSFNEKDVLITKDNWGFVDNSFFDVLDFSLIAGNTKTALSRPQTIVLTEGTAKNLFGVEDPIGKSVKGLSGVDFEVTGIAAEPPANSHLQFQALVSWSTTTPGAGLLAFDWMNNWIAQGITTYLLLKQGVAYKNLEEKFPTFMQSHLPTRAGQYHLSLQPFNEIYLNSYNLIGADMSKMGNAQYIYLFSMIAVFILLIACINHVNISTSKSLKRAKEVGLRKTLGAQKWQLIKQFMSESFLIVCISCCVALVAVFLVLPYFNGLTGKSISIYVLTNFQVIIGLAAVVILVAILSGLYPAFVLSSFLPASALRANLKSMSSGHWPRQVLIMFQFAVSIGMIACTFIIYTQMRYVLAKDLGFDKHHVLVLKATEGIQQNVQTVQDEIDKLSGVISSSAGRTALGQGSSSTFVWPEEVADQIEVRMFPVDGDFLATYGIEMANGRFFDKEIYSDAQAVVINEKLADRLSWSDPLTKTIRFNEDQPARPVIGVVKNFHFKSLYEEIEPLVMWVSPRVVNISVRFTGDPQILVNSIQTIWKKFENRYPMEFYFVDKQFEKAYETEMKLFKTVMIFAVLSIVIACMGLYGLVSFTIEQRTKEFGIRRVMGASLFSLNVLINKQFVIVLFLSSGLVAPMVYRFSGQWLAKFAYHTEVGLTPMILAIAVTLTITFLTVILQTIRAVLANPAISLKSE